jgi:hypothetical protein
MALPRKINMLASGDEFAMKSRGQELRTSENYVQEKVTEFALYEIG